jgi:hypothetical protein
VPQSLPTFSERSRRRSSSTFGSPREVITGLAIGTALAVIAAPAVWRPWSDPRWLAVGLSLLAACSTATVAAMALPWLFEMFGLDPAFGSGPLTAVVQDLPCVVMRMETRSSRIVAVLRRSGKRHRCGKSRAAAGYSARTVPAAHRQAIARKSTLYRQCARGIPRRISNRSLRPR